jgi:hypothetical protein
MKSDKNVHMVGDTVYRNGLALEQRDDFARIFKNLVSPGFVEHPFTMLDGIDGMNV